MLSSSLAAAVVVVGVVLLVANILKSARVRVCFHSGTGIYWTDRRGNKLRFRVPTSLDPSVLYCRRQSHDLFKRLFRQVIRM
jgi:hypothetical protein